MNAPIKYFGGKGTMFNNIIKEFPDINSYNTYIEPFGGSYSIGLKKNGITPIEIYNDLDKNVYSLYKVLSDENLFNLFKAKCDVILYVEDLRKEFKEKLKDNTLSVLDRAFYFFYVNRCSHNGIGGFSINTTIRRNTCKSISDMLSSIDRLPELHERLSNVIVTNKDGISLINKYNTQNVFIYCDPPYEQSTRTSARYNIDMDTKQHEDFLNAVVNSNAKILISGYDCALYNILNDNNKWEKIQFSVNTINGNYAPKTKIETLWKNY